MRLEDPGSPGYRESRYDRAAPGADDGLVETVLLGIGGLLVALLRGVWWLVVWFPLPALALGVFGLAAWRGLAVPVGVALVVLGIVAVIVRLVYREWWRAHITGPRERRRVRAWLRKNWPVLCDRVGLTVTDRDRRTRAITESTPGLAGLAWSESKTVLRGTVQLVPGQLVDDLGEVAERLGEAVRAHGCRITRISPGTAQLTLLFADPLADVVAPLPITDEVDFAALPVGLCEDGTMWRLRLAGTHVLVAGSTGAGKGSVVWSMLRALAPAIHAGSVRVWAVDGKAGMELAPGRGLFTRFATDLDDGVELLEDAVREMTRRAVRLAGRARVHTGAWTSRCCWCWSMRWRC